MYSPEKTANSPKVYPFQEGEQAFIRLRKCFRLRYGYGATRRRDKCSMFISIFIFSVRSTKYYAVHYIRLVFMTAFRIPLKRLSDNPSSRVLQTASPHSLSLRATEGSAAIPVVAAPYGIASSLVAPRNNIVTRSLCQSIQVTGQPLNPPFQKGNGLLILQAAK
jgi:hypothetical protein